MMKFSRFGQLKTVFPTMLISLLFLAACSSGDGTNENWETYSTNGPKKKEGIDYTRPGSPNGSSAGIKPGKLKENLGGKINLTNQVSNKMFREYGAMFVAKNGAVPPAKVVFDNEAEVSAWQSGVPRSRENIDGIEIELQKPAMDSLRQAINDARQRNLTITPRGTDAAKRDYAGTVSLWKSRVDPGLSYWVKKGRLTQADADRIRALPVSGQISEIFRLEDQGMYFSTDKSKSIIYSVAPPGTSQHISMLALDVAEHDNSAVRDILAKHGWFQTVISDAPHFTYLGVNESQLPQIGLKKTSGGGRTYWIPDV